MEAGHATFYLLGKQKAENRKGCRTKKTIVEPAPFVKRSFTVTLQASRYPLLTILPVFHLVSGLKEVLQHPNGSSQGCPSNILCMAAVGRQTFSSTCHGWTIEPCRNISTAQSHNSSHLCIFDCLVEAGLLLYNLTSLLPLNTNRY